MGLQTVEEEQDIHEKDVTPIEKPTAEIEQTMASKTLDIPKIEVDMKMKNDVPQTPMKQMVENIPKSTPKEKAVSSEPEDFSETPAF